MKVTKLQSFASRGENREPKIKVMALANRETEAVLDVLDIRLRHFGLRVMADLS